MATKKIRDTDFLTLSAIIRARETRQLTPDRMLRMLESEQFADAAKLLEECGYADMSAMNVFEIEDALSRRRAELYSELAKTDAAIPLVQMFMLKYDYHNVKTLVKSMGANMDSTRILSDSGRVSAPDIVDAFISGERAKLPERLRTAISEGVGILSRTSNPQQSDIAADRHYYAELTEIAKSTGDDFIAGYARLVVDSANLRTFVRSARTNRTREFLVSALFDGGNVKPEALAALEYSGNGLAGVFTAPELANATRIAPEVITGGAQTDFERECDNSLAAYASSVRWKPFGAAVVVSYLLALDWEMMMIRMILSGRLAGVATETIRERLREAYV